MDQAGREASATAGRAAALSGWLAAVIALLGSTCLLVEFCRSLSRSFLLGHSLGAALFAYLRFFTILSNIALAALMWATVVATLRGRPRPDASLYRAVLVYIAVTCATYELLLRRLWSPHGLQFWIDLDFHDVQPALMLVFWLLCAPKRELRWRNLPWLLVYPAVYFAFTLGAGALGAGYPYGFLDAANRGYPAVVETGLVFLALFYGLGALATVAASAADTVSTRLLTGGRAARA